MRLKQLQDARAKAAADARATYDRLIAAAQAEGRGLSEAEEAEAKAAEQKIAGLDRLIAAEQRRIELERTAPAAAVLEAGPVGDHQPVITGGEPRAAQAPWLPGPAGFGQFAMSIRQAVCGGGIDPRLYRAAATGLNEALGPDGGFALPVEHSTAIERQMYEVGQLLSRVDAREISGNAISYTVARETSRADSYRGGGVLGYWVDEAGAPTASKPQLDKIELKLRKVGCLGYVTEELMQDAAALAQDLQRAFVDELTFQVEDSIYRGAGANKPQGFKSAPCLVTVTIETGQTLAASAFINANISKMWIRMRPRDRANAVWLVNPEMEPWLDILSIAAGTAALEPRYVNYGPDGILRMKGRPVVWCEYSDALGTIGDIVLANLQQYRLIRRGGVQTASSIHVAFAAGEQCFRAIYRVDGQAVPRSAVSPYKGSATTSPFVVLGTRS
jgi:HK97 family phage major capsid protein